MNKKLKLRRGFSLVELMVVVAIMGTLAAIAIPAYNEYRKAAKKTAYKTDLLSLHKGWQAFGVELDSFCERETGSTAAQKGASISNVGMDSLTNSKLYGVNTAVNAQVGVCTAGACVNSRRVGRTCAAATDCNAPAIPAGNGPGKVNFIGFGAETCNLGSQATLGDILLEDGSLRPDNDCSLGVTTYKMGVFGHISGSSFIGVQVENSGVVTERAEVGNTQANLETTCT